VSGLHASGICPCCEGSGYEGSIREATDCTAEEAAGIEELMRLESGGTLDHLTRAEFHELAEIAHQAYAILKGYS
jgi:hypothetical protein